MNRLNREQRAHAIHLLCEGISIRAAARVTGISKTTILKLLEDVGRAAAWYQNRTLRNLPCERIQVDEIWGFVGFKEARRTTVKNRVRGGGDAWLWICTCADTKLVPSFYIGSRDSHSAYQVLHDLSQRLDGRKIQLTTDGLRTYIAAVERTFDLQNIDFAQLQKLYGPSYEGAKGSPERRYSPAICIGARRVPIFGDPNPDHISTSYAERNNLNVRMHSRRMTRLTNAFSKKIENHMCAMALHFLYYNFVRVHKTLKTTPAIAAGVTTRLWQVSDIVGVLESWEAVDFRAAA